MVEIPITFEEESNFDVQFDLESDFDVEFNGVSRGDYHGEYNVTPTEEEQTLYTTDKLLHRNVVVGAISSTYIGSDVPDGNILEYGLTDGTLPIVGVAKVGQAGI